MMRSRLGFGLVMLTLFLGLLGCSDSSTVNSNEPGSSTVADEEQTVEADVLEDAEPVTLRMHQTGSYMFEEDFRLLIEEPLKERYPHITVENVTGGGDLEALYTKSEIVDFVLNWDGVLSRYTHLNAYVDLEPMAKKYNLDLGRFDQGALNAIKSVSEEGELYALPYAVNFNALYYNQDIFDEFGVGYPPDGMTWEETIDLARQVTREVDGVQYYGLYHEGLPRITFPLSLNIVDVQTEEVMVNYEDYKRAFEIGAEIFSIPGNEYKGGGWNRFFADKDVAMMTSVNLFSRLQDVGDIRWDIAQFPSYEHLPNVSGMYDLHIIIPTSTSEHPDAQMQVLEVLFSDEVQTTMVTQTARVSALKDPKYQELFARDYPGVEDKNVSSIFKSSPAPAPGYSVHYGQAANILNAEFQSYVLGEKDVNTALREAKEQIEQHIASLK